MSSIFQTKTVEQLLAGSSATGGGLKRTHVTTIITGFLVALGATILDDDETYDLTNIESLFAFLVVCIGVLALRMKDPDRHRPFRVPFVWVVAPLGAAGCLYTRYYLPTVAWERFGVWLLIGTAPYFLYGQRNSVLSAQRDQARPPL